MADQPESLSALIERGWKHSFTCAFILSANCRNCGEPKNCHFDSDHDHYADFCMRAGRPYPGTKWRSRTLEECNCARSRALEMAREAERCPIVMWELFIGFLEAFRSTSNGIGPLFGAGWNECVNAIVSRAKVQLDAARQSGEEGKPGVVPCP